jgi:phage terminase large subunit-like protein
MKGRFLKVAASEPGATLIRRLDGRTAKSLNADFTTFHHEGQLPPDSEWRTWMILAGRGFGKTRAGAEWVLAQMRATPCARIALIAATLDEARRVMVEGPSGLLRVAMDGEVHQWSAAQRTLSFKNGSMAILYSGANPESLRGPEHHFAWADELAKWKYSAETWDNLQMGLRMGKFPRATVTTTPRSVPVLRRILEAHDSVRTGGSTNNNLHLPQSFVDAMQDHYGGTRIALQELEGRLFDDVEGSLWPLELINRCRVACDGGFAVTRTVIGVDPPASANGTCGIIVCATAKDGKAYVLADCSVAGASPEGWARAVADAATAFDADRVVAERNQGGAMVRSVLLAASATLPVELVHAAVGKSARAEPVAALFENGRAFFAGEFAELEAELTGLIPGGYVGEGKSPDRADAMVWALWALMLKGKKGAPRIRVL